VRPCDIPSIHTELNQWWDDIAHGRVVFTPALPMLREFLPAYIPGHLIIVSGYTSAGKSQLLAQMTTSCCGVEYAPTLIFSLEDSRQEKVMAIASVITSVHKRDMLLGTLDNGKRELVDAAMETIKTWPLNIYDDVRTLNQIEKMVREQKPKICIVDYIQRLKVSGSSIYEKMSEAAGVLFDTAQDVGCTLIVASQIAVSDAKENNNNVISLKGAGEIAEAAHTVIQLRKGREAGKWAEVEMAIKKNKAFGKCGIINEEHGGHEFNQSWTEIIPKPAPIVGFHSERLKQRGRGED
jgi:replicative DNA helicase